MSTVVSTNDIKSLLGLLLLKSSKVIKKYFGPCKSTREVGVISELPGKNDFEVLKPNNHPKL